LAGQEADVAQITLTDMQRMIGRSVYDSQHERIGWIDEIFVDDATRKPEWIGIGEGILREKHLVPVLGARIEGDGLMVPYAKAQVDETPDISGQQVSIEQERELYHAYGIGYSQEPSPSGLGAGEELPSGASETQTESATPPSRLRRYSGTESAGEGRDDGRSG
jgi:hypothetical protein